MTGLLQRLAARAAGNAWTVRSDARLPFHAIAMETAQEPEPPMESSARRGPVHRADPHEAPALDAGVHRSRTRPPAPSPNAIEPGGQQAPQEQPPPMVGDMLATHALRAPVSTPSPAARVAPDAKVAATSTQAQDASPVGPAPSPATRRADPPPLMPARAPEAGHASSPAQVPPTVTAWTAARSEATAEPEVHIHIGRIDVTAVHETPRPRAKPRERAQPVSLDAYLAARSRQP